MINQIPAAKKYRIRAHLLCHDVRLNTCIETIQILDHPPAFVEAERILWLTADELVAKHACEGCPYDLFEIEIHEVFED